MKNPFDKILNWYFTKNSLPYWCILFIDCAIIICSGFIVYLLFRSIDILLLNAIRLMNTMLIFTANSTKSVD